MTLVNKTKNTFVLTTPLYYVNDVPHIGSAYTTIAADVIARFQRLLGNQVLLITGTDEHGQKIQRTAENLGKAPQEFCDEIVPSFLNLWQVLNIQYDRFSRTTTANHQAIVKEFFQQVWENGDIYQGQQKGWYCVSCEEFKEERELLDDKRCPIHTTKPVEWRDEQNYFFRLSKYQTKLEEFYQSRPDFIQPASRRNEVLNFVSQGLQDFSISRVNLDWGFPVPVDSKHTLYVWFDALLGYVTALLEPDDPEPTLANALKTWWPINLHLIGKDILRFHAVYWPAMLMSANLPLPERVFGHGFLTKDGQKMGKTLGNTLDPIALVKSYGSDAVRYYFLKEIEFGKDGDFNEIRFINVLNADLANDLGNLLNRTLNMVQKYCAGKVPAIAPEVIPVENPLKAIGLRLGEQVKQAYETPAFSEACLAVLSLVQASNKFIDEQAPWSLYKQGKQEEVEAVLYTVLESVRLAAYLLSPIIPNISSDIYQQLGWGINFNNQPESSIAAPFTNHAKWGLLSDKQQLGTPQPIFKRIEPLKND
ncbi:methionine--tRNA ligase [Anabaena cylindrica FACHB-243]|uniref:Methionine--tRNA ligase n=1 Tax=Anabaena cylindrica (strain ATCC 27899 / PCC 7122) TaxID=272123 RepID=K9ZNY2_ANACC|nr:MULTISPECIES: methionine--tRNA ligase [Anabaena]AFZ60504.1 methionyl-tRNA synthetase [Anabaena cylindrica PCC 7122]MBD2419004.1 methionine--tRNA ligase [Anabaena cylindrica FACHB-243]MBY5282931.1 methionine--tRNA ligase [Anabaena sp. CCAP 1446/1C]MBY5309962.1 methionine--tRNA ligase [Anabaena sp. CCAP 1446/1C]MCM2407228.1 methionine--tRNA ligase [Anabaena sp. CCAP 1446/1C]